MNPDTCTCSFCRIRRGDVPAMPDNPMFPTGGPLGTLRRGAQTVLAFYGATINAARIASETGNAPDRDTIPELELPDVVAMLAFGALVLDTLDSLQDALGDALDDATAESPDTAAAVAAALAGIAKTTRH